MLLAVAFFLTANLYAQSFEKIWQTDSLLKIPESVLYNPDAKILYVSNINGSPMEKDGNGSVGKVSPDGKIIDPEWVTGLNAPKGLGLYKNLLYAADIDEVVVIDTKNGSIVQRIPVEGSVMLNDISADKRGIIYVSDSRGGKVYRIENGKPSLFLDNVKGVNGVLATGNDFYLLAGGRLQKAGADNKLITLAEGMDQSTDGIEMVKENEFIVSCWSGIVYYVKADGTKETLLDTRNQKINSADIGYDPKNRIVYIPTFHKKSVYAYKLK